jgi:hypothetical protein
MSYHKVTDLEGQVVESIAEWLAGVEPPDDMTYQQACSLYVHAFTYNKLTVAPVAPEDAPATTVAEDWRIAWLSIKIAVLGTLASSARWLHSKLLPGSGHGSTSAS